MWISTMWFMTGPFCGASNASFVHIDTALTMADLWADRFVSLCVHPGTRKVTFFKTPTSPHALTEVARVGVKW